MAVIRVNKTKDFTVMSNAHFKEREMSLKAKGLLSLMLSLPDEWDYSVRGLVTLSSDGNKGTEKALLELEKFGYVKRSLAKDQKGRFAGYDYDIYESPQGAPFTEKRLTEKRLTEKPSTEKPLTEKGAQLNTNSLNTEESKTDELSIADIVTEFETLWKLYPNKQGKAKALKAYQKARKNGVSYETVKQGIENYNGEIKAKKTAMEFIKHGSTWFNGECWNDEYGSKPTNQFAQLKGGLTV